MLGISAIALVLAVAAEAAVPEHAGTFSAQSGHCLTEPDPSGASGSTSGWDAAIRQTCHDTLGNESYDRRGGVCLFVGRISNTHLAETAKRAQLDWSRFLEQLRLQITLQDRGESATVTMDDYLEIDQRLQGYANVLPWSAEIWQYRSEWADVVHQQCWAIVRRMSGMGDEEEGSFQLNFPELDQRKRPEDLSVEYILAAARDTTGNVELWARAAHFMTRVNGTFQEMQTFLSPSSVQRYHPSFTYQPSRTFPKKIMRYYLPPNPIVVEAGVEIGWDTIMLQQELDATVLGFEPDPWCFAMATKNTRGLQRIRLTNAALSNTTGIGCLHRSSHPGASSLTLADDAAVTQESVTRCSMKNEGDCLVEHEQACTDIQTFVLDDWLQQRGYCQVDMLWLDMEGFELVALEASPRTLSQVKLVYIETHLELSFPSLEKYHYQDVRRFFIENGFIEVYNEGIPMDDIPIDFEYSSVERHGGSSLNAVFVRRGHE